jgi:hypothetical protein
MESIDTDGNTGADGHDSDTDQQQQRTYGSFTGKEDLFMIIYNGKHNVYVGDGTRNAGIAEFIGGVQLAIAQGRIPTVHELDSFMKTMNFLPVMSRETIVLDGTRFRNCCLVSMGGGLKKMIYLGDSEKTDELNNNGRIEKTD